MTALLECGADANARFDGGVGHILAMAAEGSPAIIKTLYEHGADFKAAIALAQSVKKYGSDCAEKLEFFQASIQEAAALRQEIAEMRQELASLKPAPSTPETPPPVKAPYPSLKLF